MIMTEQRMPINEWKQFILLLKYNNVDYILYVEISKW